jgi:hypothetical protein
MKPLQRYNVDTVFERTWNDDGWQDRLQIEESDNGDWVKWEDVTKLEKQNEKMLSILKKVNEYVLFAERTRSIYGRYVYVNFLDIFQPETISDIRSIIQKVEGENQ